MEEGRGPGIEYHNGETLLRSLTMERSLEPIIRLLGLTTIYEQVACQFHQGDVKLKLERQ